MLKLRITVDQGGVVALSSEFRNQHGLPDAAVSPEDPDKMLYLVAGYHQLHCAVRTHLLQYR